MKIGFRKGFSTGKIPYVIEKIEENYKINTGKVTLYSTLQEYNTKYELYDLWGEPLACEITSRNMEDSIKEICNCIAIPCYFLKEVEMLINTDMIKSEDVRNKIFCFFAYLVGIYNEKTEAILLSKIRKINFEAAYNFMDEWIGLDELEEYIIYYMEERREY